MPKRRFFIALEVKISHYEDDLMPKGRILEAQRRHMTLAFLGNIESQNLLDNIENIPPLPFKVQRIAYVDSLLFLPEKYSRVVAGHLKVVEGTGLLDYQKQLVAWLQGLGFVLEERGFLPHVTLARGPFQKKAWIEWFEPTWCSITALHLYESFPQMLYVPIKTWELGPAYIEVPHTADIAFLVRADDRKGLFLHALAALCDKFPPLMNYYDWKSTPDMDFDETINALNDVISKTDSDIGCPFKAVSWHGKFIEKEGLWEWEMIVDV